MVIGGSYGLTTSNFQQLCAAYAGFIFGKFACKVNIQRVSFALPLNLATPTAVALLIGLCKLRLNTTMCWSLGYRLRVEHGLELHTFVLRLDELLN